jgi:flavin-dependent thymidylate synthase
MDGARATENRQAGPARKAEPLTLCAAKAWRQEQLAHHLAWQQSYQEALAKGVPKELARIGMPLGHYSQMRAVTGLRNWLGFLTLRMDPQAQWEIRQYANALHGLLAEEFPETLALFGVPE